MFESAASNGTRVRFLENDSETTLGEVLGTAEAATPWFSQFDTVGAVLMPSRTTLALLVAATRAGCRLVSIPTPPRGRGSEHYADWVDSALVGTGVQALVVPDELSAIAGALSGAPVRAAGEVLSYRGRRDDHGGAPGRFELVQFTSGTTGPPKGVRIPERAIIENVGSIVEALDPSSCATSVSWLPWSHDMGLIGTLLASIHAGATRVRRGLIVSMSPQSFIRRPGDWLRACSEFGAEVTAAPDFGLRQATAAVARGASGAGGLDLSRLRACLTGGEPVRPDTLRGFAAELEPCGLAPGALCPAYGMAEATLGVTMSRPGEPWNERTVVDPLSGRDLPLVSVGRPLEGCEVRVDCDDRSRILVRSTASFDGYAGSGCDPDRCPGDWISTADCGVLLDDELYVAGRLDDVVVAAGRNLNALEMDRVVDRIAGVRAGTAVAVADPDAPGYVMVCERADAGSDLERTASAIRRELVRTVSVAPNRVIVTERGQVPRTASGKPRRTLLAGAVAEGELTGSYDRSTRSRRGVLAR
ncbi:MAG: AMP-binding protein [Microthrixaceae bacterium]